MITYWWILFTVFIFLSLLGILITLFDRKKIDFKEIISFIIILSILRIPDFITTIAFVNVMTTEAEANLLSRIFMDSIGVIPGLILHFLLLTPLLFFVFVLMYYTSSITKLKGLYVGFKYTLIITCILVPIWNLIGLHIFLNP